MVCSCLGIIKLSTLFRRCVKEMILSAVRCVTWLSLWEPWAPPCTSEWVMEQNAPDDLTLGTRQRRNQTVELVVFTAPLCQGCGFSIARHATCSCLECWCTKVIVKDYKKNVQIIHFSNISAPSVLRCDYQNTSINSPLLHRGKKQLHEKASRRSVELM